MIPTLDVGQCRMVRAELSISTMINSLIPAAIIWALNVPPPSDLTGENGLASALVKATALPILVMTPIITLLVRGRLRKGVVNPLRRDAAGWLRFMPRNPLLRGVLLALAGLAVLLPVGLSVGALLAVTPLSRDGLALFNIVYGALIGMAVTPFILFMALTDAPTEVPS